MYPRSIKWSPERPLCGNGTCMMSYSGLLYHGIYTLCRDTPIYPSQLPGRATATLPSCTCASCLWCSRSSNRDPFHAIDTENTPGHRYPHNTCGDTFLSSSRKRGKWNSFAFNTARSFSFNFIKIVKILQF